PPAHAPCRSEIDSPLHRRLRTERQRSSAHGRQQTVGSASRSLTSFCVTRWPSCLSPPPWRNFPPHHENATSGRHRGDVRVPFVSGGWEGGCAAETVGGV